MDSTFPTTAKAAYEQFLIKDFGLWGWYAHEHQYHIGRSYAWLKRDGKMDLLDLYVNEKFQLDHLVLPAIRYALRKAFGLDSSSTGPDLLNYEWFGNLRSHGHHGHMHVIPRYARPVHFNGEIYIDHNFGNRPRSSEGASSPPELVRKVKEALLRALE